MKTKKIQDFTKPHFDRTMDTILALDWKNPQVYGDFLAQTYHHICHSTRLLSAAGAKLDISRDDLHIQCIKRAAEERSHEKLSVSDLKEIGFTLNDFPESVSTKSLYRSIYYLIDYVSPLSMFGYAYFLECVGVAGGRLENILVPTYGQRATKHVMLHAKEDPEHIEAYEEKMNLFTGNDRLILEEAIVTTAANYERIYKEIAERTSSSKSKALKRVA